MTDTQESAVRIMDANNHKFAIFTRRCTPSECLVSLTCIIVLAVAIGAGYYSNTTSTSVQDFRDAVKSLEKNLEKKLEKSEQDSRAHISDIIKSFEGALEKKCGEGVQNSKVDIKDAIRSLEEHWDKKCDQSERDNKAQIVNPNIKALEVSISRLQTYLEGKLDHLTDMMTFYSCKEIFESQRTQVNKAYLLQIGNGRVPVYCHMADDLDGCGGGGWTLVMKIDGTKQNFHYDSELWTNKMEFNNPRGRTGFDLHETKLPTYWNTPFSKICLGMRNDNQLNFIVIKTGADSLYALIADGHYRPTSIGRDKWKSLIGPTASLQQNCNMEGFNAVVNKGGSKARVGIINNNENDCNSCNSRIGFGTGGHDDDSNTCGNEAMNHESSDNGGKHIKTMGYILVQ